jgi:hypothetical protein
MSKRLQIILIAIGSFTLGVGAVIAVLNLNAKASARKEIRSELMQFKVSIQNGLTVDTLRDHKNKLAVCYELNKAMLPKSFSLASLNLYIDTSEHFWQRTSVSRRGGISGADALCIKAVLVEGDPVDDVYLKAADIALSTNSKFFAFEWEPKVFTKKSLSRCGDEVEKLLKTVE